MQKPAKQVLTASTDPSPASLTLAQCAQEVIELHAFFQAWLDGSLPATDAAFDRFLSTAHPQFALISPDGAQAGRDATAGWIRAAHGTRPGVRLWTTDHVLRYADQQTAVMTYREWQTNGATTTLRLSTAVLCAAPDTPNDVAWVHVHETWLPAPADATAAA